MSYTHYSEAIMHDPALQASLEEPNNGGNSSSDHEARGVARGAADLDCGVGGLLHGMGGRGERSGSGVGDRGREAGLACLRWAEGGSPSWDGLVSVCIVLAFCFVLFCFVWGRWILVFVS